MSRYSFLFLLFVFCYFLINSVVLFFQGENWGGLCCLTIAIGLPYSILKKDDYLTIGGILMLFSVIGTFSNFFERLDSPEHQYFEYVIETFEGGYFGEHEKKITLACGIQSNIDNMQLVFDLFKSIYYDVFLSAIDFVVSQFSEPLQNKCLNAVEELRKDYPGFKAIPNK